MYQRNSDGVVIDFISDGKRYLRSYTKRYYERSKRVKKMSDKSRKINRK